MSSRLNVMLAMVFCFFSGCQSASFKGNSNNKDYNNDPTNIVEQCKDKSKLVGANIIFVIDNSNSNSYTDCKDPIAINSSYTTNRCQGQSERERSVLLGFDILKQVSQVDEIDVGKASRTSLVIFPSGGSTSWYDVNDSSRTAIASKLNTTLARPYGWTPYLEGLNGASSLFGSNINDSSKENVIIFITDGEPTDKNVSSLKNKISQLKNQNVKIFSILYKDPSSRESDLIKTLQNSGYSSDTINQLVGRNGYTKIIDEMSERVVNISSSSQLEDALTSIMKTAIRCE